MTNWGAVGTKDNVGRPACVTQAGPCFVRALTLGTAPFLFNMLKSTSDGSPAQPSLLMAASAWFTFRWAVKAGARTLSVAVKQPQNGSPRPSMRVQANPGIGVAADVSCSAPSGAGWVTIGPLSVAPSSSGVLLVTLYNNMLGLLPCWWDHLVADNGLTDDFDAWTADGVPMINLSETQTGVGGVLVPIRMDGGVP